MIDQTNMINGIGDPDYGVSLEILTSTVNALDSYALELGATVERIPATTLRPFSCPVRSMASA